MRQMALRSVTKQLCERVKRVGARSGKLAPRLQKPQMASLFRALSPLGRASIARRTSRTVGTENASNRLGGEPVSTWSRERACNH